MKTRNLIFAIAIAAALRPGVVAGNTYQLIRAGQASTIESETLKYRDAHGNTPLHQAVISGNVETVKLLLERGAEVDARNHAGATALMLAGGDTAKIELLVHHGADVNARSGLGNTPLITTARANESAKAVALLLKKGAEVNATNRFGANAIISAAASGDVETVKLLIEHGADVNSHCRASQEAAIWGGGRSPLMWAALRNDPGMIRLLLKHGAQVNEQEGFGTALTQAAWMDRPEAAKVLLKHGADVHATERFSGFTALHWAAQSENGSAELTRLLLEHGANPNAEGGEPVDAYMGVAQTPTGLAQKRGETDILRALLSAGGKRSPVKAKAAFSHAVENGFDAETLKLAIDRALPAIQQSAATSKKSFVSHASKQDCVSCHQQYLPLSAMAAAGRSGRSVNLNLEEAVLEMVRRDNSNLYELTAEATFHPEPAHGYGYALFALAEQKQPATPETDAMVHHLLVVQGKDGQWFNNLPRAPIQTSDVGATALAVRGLTQYGSPAQAERIRRSLERARHWLAGVKARNMEERVYQILGLVWAGENPNAVSALAAALRKEQRADGGWSQLASLESDAYATGQALYALKTAGEKVASREFRAGLKYLLATQREDGTWLVARRAFPFQPTMNSGYAHGRDSWISASGASWAVMGLAAGVGEERLVSAAR